MKKHSLILLLTVFIFSCSHEEVENNEEKRSELSEEGSLPIEMLKGFEGHPVMFYNVENLFDTINDPAINDDEFTPEGSKKWGRKRYEDKLGKLSQVLSTPAENNPLMFGLAEIENRFVILDLVRTGRLAQTKYRIAHYDSPDARGIDVGLVFDTERFFLLNTEALQVSIEGEPNFKTRDILYVKGLLKDSIPLHVFVNHWSSRRGGAKESEYKRIKAAEVLKRKSDSILKVNPEANIIYMGDFNDYPTDKSIVEILHTGAPDEVDEDMFINLLFPHHLDRRGTHNYRGKWGALDQLIISPAIFKGKTLAVDNTKAKILYEDYLLYEHPSGDKTPSKTYGGPNYYGGYSDHLAVYMFLSRSNK